MTGPGAAGAAAGGTGGGAAGAEPPGPPDAGAAGASADAARDAASVQTGADAAPDVGVLSMGAGCSAPGTLCWDFEEGTLPAGWTMYRSEYAAALLVDNTRPHRGTYALHAKDFKGGTEGNQGGPKKTMRFNLPAGFGPVMWGRAFVYTTPARPSSHAGLFNARYPRPGSMSTDISTLDWYEAATYMGTYMSIWHPPEPPG
jgi:hypothetical protein